LNVHSVKPQVQKDKKVQRLQLVNKPKDLNFVERTLQANEMEEAE